MACARMPVCVWGGGAQRQVMLESILEVLRRGVGINDIISVGRSVREEKG